MAETVNGVERHYSLTLKVENGSSGQSESPIAGQNSNAEATPSEGGNITPKNVIKTLVSFNSFVKPFVQPVIDQHIQTVSLRTGSEESQQKIQFAYSVGEQAVGLLSSITIGAIVGNLPGALIGAITSIGTTAINYANNVNRIDMERSLESISLRGMTVRSGGYAPSYAGSRQSNQ